MQLDDVSRDRQTEPEAGAFRGAVALTQTLEHMRQKRRVDPLTFVAHGDADLAIRALQPQIDLFPGRRELDRVGKNVADDLLQTCRVGGDDIICGFNFGC